ncbi:MAG: RsmD family RNA methyltransferase [Phycisphaerales bacterium]
MRIIAGKHRSRMLNSLPGLQTRPMPDRVRESVFGMLGTRVQNATVLDLFSGSGAIGLEAYSRGAAACILVDNDRDACGVIEANVRALRCESQCRVVQGDALGIAILSRVPRPLDLVFLDPPYPLVIDPAGWERVRAHATRLAALLAPDGFLVLRTPRPFVHESLLHSAEVPVASELHRTLDPRLARKKAKAKERRGRRNWRDDGEPGPDGERGGMWVSRIDRPDAKPVGEPDQASEVGGEGVRVFGIGPVAAGPAIERTVADLSIPGLRGPETHDYGTTAVHWYMQRAAEG